MPLRVRCECGEMLTVPQSRAGTRVLCPTCNRQVVVPPPRTVPPPVPAKNPPSAKPSSNKKTAGDDKAQTPAATAEAKQTKRPQPRAEKPREAPIPPPAPPQPPPRKPRTSEGGAAKPKGAAQRVKPASAPPTLPLPPSKGDETTRSTPKPAPPAAKASQPTEPPRAESESPPPARPPVEEPLRGVEYDPGKKWTVYQIGMAVAGLALAGAYPAGAEIVRHLRDFDSTGVEAWAYFLLLLTGIQLAYALYLVQLPDWSTTWVVMIVCACVTVLYAGGMGVSLMARPDNELLSALGLSQMHARGYLSPWCLIMTLLMSLLTYFLIRASVKWHKAFELAMAGRG